MGLFAKKTTEIKILTVEGMKCEHCKARVEKALGSLSGVDAEVELASGKVKVTMKKDHTDDELRNAVEDLGFTVKDIAPFAE